MTGWARTQTDVQGLALVGSYAYGRPRMASDVDLVLVTAGKQAHVDGMAWVAPLDRNPRLIRCQEWGSLSERRVRLSSGLLCGRILELFFNALLYIVTVRLWLQLRTRRRGSRGTVLQSAREQAWIALRSVNAELSRLFG